MRNTGYFEQVYEIVKTIPLGKVATYGDIARLSGYPRRSQIVGFALHVNPYQGTVPCHRVVNRFGELAPAFAFGGAEVQAQMLKNEGVEITDFKVDLNKYRIKL